MSFSENLKNLLKVNNVTQLKLANDLKITSASVSRYCAGEQYPRQRTLCQIAAYFGVTQSQLVGDGEQTLEEDTVSLIISLLPHLRIKELESVKSYTDYLIAQKLYSEDVNGNSIKKAQNDG